MYKVIILKEGYSISEAPGHQKACGSITLVKGPKNIVVDTGNPWDKELIQEEGSENTKGCQVAICDFDSQLKVDIAGSGLKKNNLTEGNIDYVVCTHGHSDHVGNLNLFINATHIVSHDICHGDEYLSHDFSKGIPYEIDDNVEVIPTAGHTGTDVSVIVHGTDHGVVAVTGDLFECFEDLENPHLWQDNSQNPELQQHYRIKVLRKADYIVPGHGKMFKVPEEYKQQMRVVMYYEEHTYKSGSAEAMSQYLVWEEDDSI